MVRQFRKSYTVKKVKYSIEDFFSKCDQLRWKLWIWSHLLKKCLMENFIFLQWYVRVIYVLYPRSPHNHTKFRGVSRISTNIQDKKLYIIVNGFHPSITVVKLSILDLCRGPDYASEMFDFLLNQSLDIVKTRTEVFSASRFLVKSLIFKTSNNTGTKSNIGIKLGIDTYHKR